MQKTIFFDSTLRDGSHAIKHQLSEEQIRAYCRKIDGAGLDVVIVGHGNGLGASSLQVGLSKLSDVEMLTAARQELNATKLGVYFIPGFGTIHDDLQPAIEIGVDVVTVGTHCTEADVTRQHLEYARSMGKDAYGVLMMYHMTSKENLLENARKMESYGAQGVVIMDSAGASTPEMVADTISYLSDNLTTKVGFHAHNNLGLAVSNSYIAIKSGAAIIDATIKGFGAGAGNCPLEVLAGLLVKEKHPMDLDFYRLLDIADDVMPGIMKQTQDITALSVISGLSGVFSAYAPKVKIAAARFDVDARDIFIEMGKRKVVAGQDDIIVEVASHLADIKKNANDSYEIESLL